ncbi:hypothetical protein HPB47_019850 [Ixodes persulcatus]|uniref:Uncharacterized protein n=1 Tax=Ixodes persulcatus TaxID=34615 RepID=A0AC60QH23_IXOPE|nr:hypothetical protein HPB47_019850 [Ixodes persulcatus]
MGSRGDSGFAAVADQFALLRTPAARAEKTTPGKTLRKRTSESPSLFASPRRVPVRSVSPSLLRRLPIDLGGTFRALALDRDSTVPALHETSDEERQAAFSSPLQAFEPATEPRAVPLTPAPSCPAFPLPVQGARLPPQREQTILPTECQPLARYLEVQNEVPASLTLVLTEPQPQWCLVDGQPTLAVVQDVVPAQDLLTQAMSIAGIPVQPQPIHHDQSPEDTDDPDTHQIGAQRILEYLETHQPPVPPQADQSRNRRHDEEEDQTDTQEDDTRRQAARPAGPPHPPVRVSPPPPEVNWPKDSGFVLGAMKIEMLLHSLYLP